MKFSMKASFKNRKSSAACAAPGGFTLIELLLVLVILATLSAIIVPKFAGRSEQSRQTSAVSGIKNLETALDAFEADCGRYPTQSEGFSALAEEPSDTDGWHGPYIKEKTPKDPWGQPYVYRYPATKNRYGYDVYSSGANKNAGDLDDVGNWSDDD